MKHLYLNQNKCILISVSIYLDKKLFDHFQPESHISQRCNKYSPTLNYSHVEEKKIIPNQGKLLCDLWERLSYRAVIKGPEWLSVGLETARPLRRGLRNNTLLQCWQQCQSYFYSVKDDSRDPKLGQCIVSQERAVQKGKEVRARFKATWCFRHFTFTLAIVTQTRNESNGWRQRRPNSRATITHTDSLRRTLWFCELKIAVIITD